MQQRPFLVIILAILILSSAPPPVAAENISPPRLSAEAAVLIDGLTGHVLYSQNADREMHPASTTKILTALLGLELGKKKDVVTISRYAAYTEGTSLYLNPGDRLCLFDLIRGALINSGNDAATAIAEYIGGNEEFFSSLMTYKAKTLGAYRSRFRNPHGLTDFKHIATAYDLALMTRYALKNKDFRQIVRTKDMIIHEIKTGEPIPLSNTNRLLYNRGMRVIGVKTGTTAAAGQCLIAAAEKKGRVLISVVLNSSDRYNDTLELFNYGFNRCRWYKVARQQDPILSVPVSNGRIAKVKVGTIKDKEIAVKSGELNFIEKRYIINPDLKAPLAKGTNVGKIEVYLGDHLLYNCSLITLEAVKAKLPFYRRIFAPTNFLK